MSDAMRCCAAALAALTLTGAACGKARASGFDVTVLGARGGLEDGNLSAYFVRPVGDRHGILLDAGTVMRGLQVADGRGALRDYDAIGNTAETRVGRALHDGIRACFLSHAHLDHVAGLIAVSPDDVSKPLYALPSVNARLERHVFNWDIWPNMTDRGVSPRLGVYRYHDLVPGRVEDVPGTALRVTAYPLSHGGVESTAFLVWSGNEALLYLGDTGPDAVEHSASLRRLWSVVAPLAREHRLRGIIIECSYDDSRPDRLLFGHLSPRWLSAELRELSDLAHDPLTGLLVVLGHIKPTLLAKDAPQERILKELKMDHAPDMRFVVAEQGMRVLMKG